MVMSYIWFGIVLISLIFALLTGSGSALAGAVTQGAQAGITLAISLAGSICLWSGVAHLMERIGATSALSRLFKQRKYCHRSGIDQRKQRRKPHHLHDASRILKPADQDILRAKQR